MKVFYDDCTTLVLEGHRSDDSFFLNHEKQTVIANTITIPTPLELGINHYLKSEHFGDILIEPRFIVKTTYFDTHYTDSEARLGSYFDEGDTHFKVWAPTATNVFLSVNQDVFVMNRTSKGVYQYRLEGEQLGLVYHYELVMNGERVVTCDPYAKASLPNRGASVVADMSFAKTPLASYDDSILELHVRDFTMDTAVDFKHRGKLLGLLESVGDYGMRHILDLGMGMIQVQPLTDFETVDELNPFDRYNWGYDPMQFFALEGSYSSNIADPLQVLRDFALVVNTYHQHGIALSLDVVFNHIYEVEGSSLNACVPYYYFRYHEGKLSDGTFCGNEIASEYTMVRKLIVDACVYFVDTFGIDGYRFDLMGITDIETMTILRDKIIAINPMIKLYGEGWNMASGLPESKRASMQNHRLLPGYQFFNDHFRDTIGGPLDGSHSGIYQSPQSATINEVLNGSQSRFDAASQSINYVECHDNYTMADKLNLQGLGIEAAEIYLSAVILAQGTCFLQIGQSFFRNKQGVENSYQSDDAINCIRWHMLSENHQLNETCKSLLRKRKALPNRTLHYDGKRIITQN